MGVVPMCQYCDSRTLSLFAGAKLQFRVRVEWERVWGMKLWLYFEVSHFTLFQMPLLRHVAVAASIVS